MYLLYSTYNAKREIMVFKIVMGIGIRWLKNLSVTIGPVKSKW